MLYNKSRYDSQTQNHPWFRPLEISKVRCVLQQQNHFVQRNGAIIGSGFMAKSIQFGFRQHGSTNVDKDIVQLVDLHLVRALLARCLD